MDETKDTLNIQDEQTVQESEANNETEVVAEETVAENSDAETEQATESEGEDETEASQGDAENEENSENVISTQFESGDFLPADKPKKKSILNAPIIAAIIIVAAAAVALLVIKCFFDTSIVGTWLNSVESTSSSSSSDEAETTDVYYVFNDDMTVDVVIGTMTQYGTYSLDTDDDTGIKTVTITVGSSQSILYYDISGNVFTGKTLVLSSDSSYLSDTSSDYTVVMNNASLPNIELKPDEDFKANDSLTGKWSYDNGYYEMTYDFKEDGMVEISEALSGESTMLYARGTYTYTDDTITVVYYAPNEVEMSISYSVGDDGLTLDYALYTKDTGEQATTAAESEAEDTTAAEDTAVSEATEAATTAAAEESTAAAE